VAETVTSMPALTTPVLLRLIIAALVSIMGPAMLAVDLPALGLGLPDAGQVGTDSRGA
jgi:hypothetical protein